MKKNTIYFLGGFFAALILVASFAAFMQTATAQAIVAKIRAVSCDVDETCETNGLMSKDNVDLSGVLKITKEYTNNGTLNTSASFYEDTAFNKRVYFNSYVNFDENLQLSNGLYVTGGNAQFTTPLVAYTTVRIDRNVTLTNLQGSGTAYACLTSGGVLYRSINPCR